MFATNIETYIRGMSATTSVSRQFTSFDKPVSRGKDFYDHRFAPSPFSDCLARAISP